MSDKQGRRFLLTLNNPHEKNITHIFIKKELAELPTIIYYCISDEIGGEEKTYHTHIFLVCSSCLRFSTLKNHFPSAHIDPIKGTSAEARDYVFKTGKWEDSDKSETRVPDTQFEWGALPQERQGERTDLARLYELIKDGLSNFEIMEQNPDYLMSLDKVERARYAVREQQYRDTFRKLTVAYVFGNTGTGKTRSVMEEYGYTSVYRVTDYKSHPFDSYAGEKTLLLDEYNNGFRIQDLLNYLDGYPLNLPARYTNKVACYEYVYIISNLDLREQYKYEQLNYPEVWAAFIRRIHKVIRFFPDGTRREYDTAEYLSSAHVWKELPTDTPTPFDYETPSIEERG